MGGERLGMVGIGLSMGVKGFVVVMIVVVSGPFVLVDIVVVVLPKLFLTILPLFSMPPSPPSTPYHYHHHHHHPHSHLALTTSAIVSTPVSRHPSAPPFSPSPASSPLRVDVFL